MTKEKQNKDKKDNSGPLVSEDIGDLIPKEYLNKPIKAKRPQTKKFGIVLEDKYAKLIRSRKKKEIVNIENFQKYIGKEIFLCGKTVYGSIVLNEPIKLDRELLKNHKKRHLISDYDIDKLWSDENIFYAYSFRIKQMFKEPIKYKNGNVTFGIIDSLELNNGVQKMRDVPNLNREYNDKLKEAQEQKEQAAQEEIEEETLQSNTRLDKYHKRFVSLKNLAFGGNYQEIAVLFLSLYELYLEKGNSKIYDKNGVVLKPAPDVTENYIRVRIRDPKTIVEGSFRTITISASRGIKGVIGKLKKDPDGATHIQSVLFDKKKWSTDDALAWVKEHKESLKTADSDELKEKKEGTETEKVEWTTEYINTLPNASFAIVEPAYLDGTTKDKNARHLPFKDEDGKIDLPHYRNALARVNQIKPITKSITTKELRSKAKVELEKHRKVLEEKKKEEEKEAPKKVKVEEKIETSKIWICPHCNKEIGEKELYCNEKTDEWFHRPCIEKGPIELPKDDRVLLFPIVKSLEKRVESYVDSEYIPRDKDKGKPEEKWVWCDSCKNSFDYYKQLLEDESTVLCPYCGALVIFEEE